MSPSARLGEFKLSIQNYAADPNNTVMAQDTLQTPRTWPQAS
jgi:flagellar hook-associated protein 1 FlgK